MTAPRPLRVLCYHSIDNSESLVSVTPQRFETQMRLIAALGLRGVCLSEAISKWQAEDGSAQKLVAITLDDGYRNTFEVAWPALRRYGFSATVYLATGFLGATAGWMRRDFAWLFRECEEPEREKAFLARARENLKVRMPYYATLKDAKLAWLVRGLRRIDTLSMMSWEQARTMVGAGVEFGAHSRSHPFLTERDDATALEEMTVSKREIEEQLGLPVRSFCYPYGALSAPLQASASRAGFQNACSTVPGVNRLADANLYALRRISVDAGCSLATLSFYLSPLYPAYARWRWPQATLDEV